MSHAPARPALVMILLLALIVAGCGQPTASETPPSHYSGPTEPELEATAIWRSERDRGPRPIALTEHGVVFSEPGRAAFLITAAGKIGWRLPRSYELAGTGPVQLSSTYGSAESTMIISAYRKGSEEQGLAAFAVADGKLRWSTPLITSAPPSSGSLRLGTTVIGGSVIMAHLVPQREGHDTGEVTAVALDPRTGRQLWTQDGLAADAAMGDRVAGRRVQGNWRDPHALDGKPVVLEARSGREVWQGTEVGWWDEVPGEYAAFPATGYGVVRPGRPGDDHDPSFAVELAGGATSPIRGYAVLGLAADGPFLAWTDQSDRLWSAALAGEPRPAAEPVSSFIPTKAVGGHIWGVTGVEQSAVAHDRTGARRVDPLPGKPLAADATWLVAAEATGRVSLYRLTRRS